MQASLAWLLQGQTKSLAHFPGQDKCSSSLTSLPYLLVVERACPPCFEAPPFSLLPQPTPRTNYFAPRPARRQAQANLAHFQSVGLVQARSRTLDEEPTSRQPPPFQGMQKVRLTTAFMANLPPLQPIRPQRGERQTPMLRPRPWKGEVTGHGTWRLGHTCSEFIPRRDP